MASSPSVTNGTISHEEIYRKCTVEPVFGIIRNVRGFNRFHLEGIENVKAEGLLVAPADNRKRLRNLNAAKAAAA